MKQNSIQYLLEKYREGTLNDEERTELERLTHKDEVVAAASRRATGIIRRRVSLTIASVMVAGAGAFAVLPHSQEPLMAEAKVLPAPVVETQLAASPQEVEAVVAPTVETHPVAPLRKRARTKAATRVKSDPVVVCNNQCEADSVISDIRKFLSV